MIARAARPGKAKVKITKGKSRDKKQRGLHQRLTKAALFQAKEDESHAYFHLPFCLLNFAFCFPEWACLTRGAARFYSQFLSAAY
jgi:coproporphyrinogen III oxidase-like Fe-S oxidoreductase